MNGAAVEFRGVSYQVPNGREILHDFNLVVPRGEILVLLGRSGSGKTTALKLVNRLYEISSGDLLVESRAAREWDIIKLRRSIGYAIQEVGLFPHYTVSRNIGVVPAIEQWAPERIEARVQELLKLVGLNSDIGPRYPHQLSGGQRQRVGVARALAADPPILLMDEPFGALDPLTRAEVRQEFARLQARLQTTVILVTHDIGEALALGSHVGVIDGGGLLAYDTPARISQSMDPRIRAFVAAQPSPPPA